MKPIHAISLIVLLLASAFASCSRSSEAKARLDAAEALIVSRPDSAMAILCGIDTARLVSKADRAQFALLMSMALDKSYVDTTSFAVLQPAIDYYLKKGTPDQKLRTYYYQGRIYQNRHEYDSAMVAFIRGKEYSAQASDTLTAANLLAAQGNLMYASNIFEDYIELNLAATKLYKEIGRTDYEATTLNNALIGSIALSNEERSDSIVSVLETIVAQNEELATVVEPTIFRFVVFYGDVEEVRDAIEGVEPEDIDNDDMLIDIANAYYRLGNGKDAARFLDAVSSEGKQWLKYKSSKVNILELCGDKDGTIEAMREATNEIDSINKAIFYNDLLFLQERYAMEKSEMQRQHKTDRIIWISICIVLAMLVASSFIFYHYRLNRAKSEKLQLEIEQLHLKSEHLQLESEKLQLESENMQHRIAELENESTSLKEIMASQKDLAEPVKDAVKARLELLNAMLASMISEPETQRASSYAKWREKMLSDKDEFMNSTRQAFEATNPGFIASLRQHGLTVDEINFACLYAIGLKGSEVGDFLQTKSHYRISSEIRKKLNLGPRHTNLGNLINDLLKNS